MAEARIYAGLDIGTTKITAIVAEPEDQDGIRDPVGMSGVRLEAEVHIITGAAAACRNVIRAAERAGLEVEELVLEPLASADAVLTQDERDLGVALFDIGGGTTDLAI